MPQIPSRLPREYESPSPDHRTRYTGVVDTVLRYSNVLHLHQRVCHKVGDSMVRTSRFTDDKSDSRTRCLCIMTSKSVLPVQQQIICCYAKHRHYTEQVKRCSYTGPPTKKRNIKDVLALNVNIRHVPASVAGAVCNQTRVTHAPQVSDHIFRGTDVDAQPLCKRVSVHAVEQFTATHSHFSFDEP